ncbi:MAG: DUF3135 domain-containing protein [Saccharospirillum sp.]
MNDRINDFPGFDTLLQLAQQDPEALEALRQSLMEDLINSAGTSDSKRRLEGLRFKIDMNRRKAKNPLQSCMKLSEMMWDSVLVMSETIEKNI